MSMLIFLVICLAAILFGAGGIAGIIICNRTKESLSKTAYIVLMILSILALLIGVLAVLYFVVVLLFAVSPF